MRKINSQGLEHLKRWEGLRLEAYKDVKGIWTIGYGHTSAAGAPIVQKGLKITEAEAEAMLARDLRQYEKVVSEAVKVPLNDNQFAALVSFTYNVGVSAFKRSTLLKKLNKGDYEAVPIELMKWTRSGKHYPKGLKNRRTAEGGLWVKGEFVSSRDVRPSPVHDNAAFKPETIAPVVGALSGLGSVFSGTGPMQWAFAFVMVISCLVGAWWFIRRQKGQCT